MKIQEIKDNILSVNNACRIFDTKYNAQDITEVSTPDYLTFKAVYDMLCPETLKKQDFHVICHGTYNVLMEEDQALAIEETFNLKCGEKIRLVCRLSIDQVKQIILRDIYR